MIPCEVRPSREQQELSSQKCGPENSRRLRSILRNAKKTGLEAQNTEGHDNFSAWVSGMISSIHLTNPPRGKELWEALKLVSGK